MAGWNANRHVIKTRWRVRGKITKVTGNSGRKNIHSNSSVGGIQRKHFGFERERGAAKLWIWQATPKLALQVEGDYVIQRLWRNQAPGESSAPAHVDGGAADIAYQLTPKFALAARCEYMSDRGGPFSGITQALKENTLTFDYRVADGTLTRYEWRRDYSNQPSFLTDVQGALARQQSTATVGLI
ncbi:MAG: outer membrane beta-barrel protein [Terriglobales bacterium]